MLLTWQAKDTTLFVAGPADQQHQVGQTQCLCPALTRTVARSEHVRMQLLHVNILPILAICGYAHM